MFSRGSAPDPAKGLNALESAMFFTSFHILPDTMAPKDSMGAFPHFAKNLLVMLVMLGRLTEV